MSVVSPDKKIAYVHVPKTGGASIEAHLKSKGWSGLSFPPYKKKHHVGFHYIQQHNEELESAVTVVRNPVDYAISYYRFFWHSQIELYEKRQHRNAYKHLRQIQQGFMTWFFDHAHGHDRWKSVHTPQRRILGRDDDELSHTRVFDFKQRNDFWQHILGEIPLHENKIHQFKNISPIYLDGDDRKKILDFYKIDMDQWADQFDWQ